jgi:hypothetical protein
MLERSCVVKWFGIIWESFFQFVTVPLHCNPDLEKAMPLVAMHTALAALDSHLGPVASVASKAWDRYHQLPAADRLIFGARERANCVHAYMLHYAAEYAAQASGVRCFERNQMCGIVIDDKYAIRFKKIDEDSLSRNQPSKQVEEFRAQIELDGIDASHHLELGYVLNRLGTDLLDVRLVHPAGEGVSWAKSLTPTFQDATVADIFENVAEEVTPASIEPKETAVVLPFVIKNEET